MGHKRKYQWEEWFGRGTFTIVQKVDFHTPIHVMVQQIRNMARVAKFNCKTRIKVDDDERTITVHTIPRKGKREVVRKKDKKTKRELSGVDVGQRSLFV